MADSSLNFPRKYRPSKAKDYLGENIREIIKNRFSREETYCNIIGCFGTRGSGKTSFARLLSKYFHCMNKKEDGSPCDECEMCVEINNNLLFAEAGSHCIGVREVDITKESGKADLSEILDEALEAPMYPLKYNILILDEVHRGSPAMQNLLLKTLEEYPPHLVVFICTTDPDKLITPLKSRLELEIRVRKANEDELINRLLEICELEKITTSKEALKYIANVKGYNIRESLILLESVAKTYSHQVTLENVMKMAGAVDNFVYIEYFTAANKSLEHILGFTYNLKEKDIPFKDFMKGLTKFTLSCINVKFGIGLKNYQKEFIDQVKSVFSIYSSQEIDVLLQIIEYGNRILSNDEELGELVVNTTAMRIGKTKILSTGLYRQDIDAEKENKIGNKKAVDSKKEEQKSYVVREASLGSELLASALGNDIVSIKSEGLQLELEDDEEENENEPTMTDKDLLDLFNV